MKKLIYILIFALSGQLYAQQTVNVSIYVSDSTGNPFANQAVTIIDYGTPAGVFYNYVTNSNGYIMDSLGVQGIGTLTAFSFVTGCSDTTIFNYGTGGSVIYFTDTLVLCNAATPCNFAFGTNLISPAVFSFWQQGSPSGNVLWDFGDGTTSKQPNPTHTYSTPGTYVYCVTDSVCPPACGTLVVTAVPNPALCQASFIIDTVNSQPNTVIVWNNSTPAYNPASATQYLWDFGDGSSSTNAFPVHTYPGAGTYALCLTVVIPPSAIDSGCVSSFCDTLAVDTAGNIINKTTGTSFTLNVLDANSISVDENISTTFTVYPNPVGDVIYIDFDAMESGTVTTEILDMNGSVILSEAINTQNGNNKIRLDVSQLTGGIYFIRTNLNGELHYEKIIKQ